MKWRVLASFVALVMFGTPLVLASTNEAHAALPQPAASGVASPLSSPARGIVVNAPQPQGNPNRRPDWREHLLQSGWAAGSVQTFGAMTFLLVWMGYRPGRTESQTS